VTGDAAMSLILGRNVQAFDIDIIKRGDCVRAKRAGDTIYRNGIVTKVTESMVEVLYSNVQNNATSFINIYAVDVAVGVWEIFWTCDFKTINYHPGAGGNNGA
jgi:hypothetical protein